MIWLIEVVWIKGCCYVSDDNGYTQIAAMSVYMPYGMDCSEVNRVVMIERDPIRVMDAMDSSEVNGKSD